MVRRPQIIFRDILDDTSHRSYNTLLWDKKIDSLALCFSKPYSINNHSSISVDRFSIDGLNDGDLSSMKYVFGEGDNG